MPHTYKLKRAVGMGALGLVFLAVVCMFALSHPKQDFIEYWTASHLLRAHANPYSLNEMFKAQRAIGWTEPVPLMFVCPPWVLPMIAPLGYVPYYGVAWLLWMTALVGAMGVGSRLLMDLYFDELRIPEISATGFHRFLFAFTFYPVLLCLKYAQIAPFLLLGVAGFLYAMRRDRPLLAGAMLSLTAIKPQLLFLVWIAVLLDVVERRRWKIVASALAVILGFTVIALMLDPQAFQQYRELAATPYFVSNPSGILAMIRRSLGADHLLATYWLQFVPPVFGLVWVGFRWHRHRHRWNWVEQMPALVTGSVLTTAYGWVFDETVLAVAVISMAASKARPLGRIPWNVTAWYTALNCLIMLAMAVPPLAFIPAPIFFAVTLLRDARDRVMPYHTARVQADQGSS